MLCSVTAVSIKSAITSRDTKECLIPSVRGDGATAAGDADNGFAKVSIRESNRSEHGAIRRSSGSLGDDLALTIVYHGAVGSEFGRVLWTHIEM